MSQDSLVKWLTSAQSPSIRYLTARHLLQLPEDHPDVARSKQAIMSEGLVPRILAEQSDAGHWLHDKNYYQPKYISTHWSLQLLTELAVDPEHEGFQRGVDYMLADRTNRIEEDLASGATGFSCFWGNLLRYALYAGRGNDERVQTIIEYAISDIRTGCQCQYNNHLACAWGVVRTLWGLSALPETNRSEAVQETIDTGVHFLVKHYSLIDANYPYPEDGKVHPMWFKLNFPMFYQVDILFTLRVLAELGRLGDAGVQPALDWLRAQQLKNGRWRGRSPYQSRTWRSEFTPETSRWVSLHAEMVLQAA